MNVNWIKLVDKVFMSSASLLVFCLLVLFGTERGMLNTGILIVNLSISSF